MQVIFIKDLKGQGRKNEIKTVKDGYGENFLITKGYAVAYNDQNLAKLKRTQATLETEKNKKRDEALVLKAILEKEIFVFKVKAGEHDRVFGSISPKQLKETLNKKGYKIDKREIKLESNLATLGFHDVEIELYKDVIVKIKVQLVK
ncbi:MAG: 50S ribosomal protein L9 [Bacilli bacterium]